MNVALALTALIVLFSIIARSGITIDAALKKLEGDKNWEKYLSPGAIEDLAREKAETK